MRFPLTLAAIRREKVIGFGKDIYHGAKIHVLLVVVSLAESLVSY
jgi:hypothetical protein